MLYCVRLLTVRFSLKLRLKEEDYFKSLICNTKVGKSKTKSTIKSTCGKHPLWGLHGLARLQTTVYCVPHLWCVLAGAQRHYMRLLGPGRATALVETAFPSQDGRTALFLSACPIFQGTGI